MRLIESFSEFINNRGFLMEAATRDGYLLLLASTDPNNLKSGPATQLGISQDTEYSGTLKGAGDLVEVGKKKSFSGKLTKGKGVGPGEDFIEIETGGKKYSVKENGTIQIPFTKDSELKVKGSGNGLLALGRVCQYLSESVDNGFDVGSPFTGTIFIQLGDKKRRGQAYFSNGKSESDNPGRYSTGYVDILNKFEASEFEGEDHLNEDEGKQADILDTFADTLGDAIKAASFVANGKDWKSRWSAFKGFSDMLKAAEEQNFKWEGKTEEEKNLDKASYLLSVTFHYLINTLYKRFPLQNSKIFNVDLLPLATKIVKAQGKDLEKFDPSSIKSGVGELINAFALKKLPEYPEFTPKLPEYWNRIESYIADRVLTEMPKTYNLALTPNEVGGNIPTKGGSGGGGKIYKSGKLD